MKIAILFGSFNPFTNAHLAAMKTAVDALQADQGLFVATNGKAAGFNIALLTEIANRAQVNFELVQIETGARAMALSSNKVDAVFWTRSVTCKECNEAFAENIEGTLVTESYFVEQQAFVLPNSAK